MRRSPVGAAVLLGAWCVACAPSERASPSSARREITLLHLADLHSHLFPERVTLSARDVELGLGAGAGDTVLVGGAARIATLIEQERARADVTVTLDAGDVFEGTAVFALFGGEPEMRVADALGLDAQALGNHDLAPGAERVGSLRHLAPSDALVAANLDGEEDAAPSIVVERDGVRVRVIGLGRTPDGEPDVADCAVSAQRIVDFGAPADVTVVLSHLGTELDESLIPLTTGVDVVLGGHTHDVISPPRAVRDCGAALAAKRGCRPRPVPVVHSGAYGRYLGKVVLGVSTSDAGAQGRSVVASARVGLLPVTDAVEERPDVATLLEPYREAMVRAGLGRAVAYAPEPVSRASPGGGDSALGNVVARAMRVASGADLGVINTTGIRDDLPAGEITGENVFAVLPFDDQLVTVQLSGDELLAAFEQIRSESCARNRSSQVQLDGGSAVFACSGSRVDVAVSGHALDAGARYRVATVSFLTQPGRWLGQPQPPTSQGTVRDAFFAYVSSLPGCMVGGLPCLDARAGAAADGRIVCR